MRRDFVVRISIFAMPRCLGSESPSSVSTGFCVIVVFLVSDRSFVLDFARGCFSTCLSHQVLQSGYILFIAFFGSLISDQCLPADGAFFARENVFAQRQLCWQRTNPKLHGTSANYGNNCE